jgi:hypothetical protein
MQARERMGRGHGGNSSPLPHGSDFDKGAQLALAGWAGRVASGEPCQNSIICPHSLQSGSTTLYHYSTENF